MICPMTAGFTVVPRMSDCRNVHPAYSEALRFSNMEAQLQSLLKKKHLPLVSFLCIYITFYQLSLGNHQGPGELNSPLLSCLYTMSCP